MMTTTDKHISIGINPDTLKPYSIMLVDDAAIDRSLLRRFLQSEKFDILGEFENGDDLLYRLSYTGHKPDLICVDLHMPGKNGVEVIKELNSSSPGIKILVISATEDKSLIQSLLSLKIHGFLKKPYNRNSILDKLGQVLGRAGVINATDATAKTIHLSDLAIPPLPMVAIKIMSFDTDNPAGGSEELEKIISPDQAITTDIMKIANSAYYGRSGKIQTLRDAITLLGMKTVKNLVMLKSNKQFTKSLSGEIYQKQLHELPVLTALIAFDLTNPLGLKRIREEVFLAGLLHKIGMTILALNFPTRYSELLELANTGVRDLLHVERENFQIDHIEAGVKVFKLWNMPASLQQSIGHQTFQPNAMDMMTDVVKITRLANIFASRMLGFVIPEYDLKIEPLIYEAYRFPEELKESFKEDYYEMIKDHPFFEMMA
jgi:HD-like signal output (HDOD) protein/ActR/RegA family two-component response regulator